MIVLVPLYILQQLNTKFCSWACSRAHMMSQSWRRKGALRVPTKAAKSLFYVRILLLLCDKWRKGCQKFRKIVLYLDLNPVAKIAHK